MRSLRLDQPDLPARLPPAALLTPTQMQAADTAMAGSSVDLVHRAGWAVARAALAFGPCRVLVLCGPGNNGADGQAAAALLATRGWPVRLARFAPPRPGIASAGIAPAWNGPLAPFTPAEAARADLVIDAVFGAGLSRDVPAGVAETLAAARAVLAVDVPSGLDGATGLPRGGVRAADATITFFRLKPGHLLLPGRSLCGALELADIGIPAAILDALQPDTFLNSPELWRLPTLGPASHKYTRGHVTILGGGAMPGAARLAAAAARAGGAGLVTIAATAKADLYRAGEPGLIVADAGLADLLQDPRRRVWVCGPGLGAGAAASWLPALIAAGRQIVADADALSLCAGAPERLRGVTIITPHAGEFEKLFGPPAPDRLAAVRAAAARIGAIVVLKGADTIVAAPDGRAAINAAAPPWLATAGAGDVLAGLAAALLAQGMDPFAAAGAAVWLHGRAAARLGPGLLAEALPAALAAAAAEAARFS